MLNPLITLISRIIWNLSTEALKTGRTIFIKKHFSVPSVVKLLKIREISETLAPGAHLPRTAGRLAPTGDRPERGAGSAGVSG